MKPKAMLWTCDPGFRKTLFCNRIDDEVVVSWRNKKDKVNPTIAAQRGKDAIGIDLGLKDFAAISTGQPIEKQDIYRNAEKKLAKLQRAGKKKKVTKLHAWIKNRRKDFHHQLTALVTAHGAIFVGNVNASALAKTTMAKSVLDAGWSQFRTFLQYKCDDTGV